MKKAKVIHVHLGEVNPDSQNGVSKVIFELASHQHATGLKVEVWSIIRKPAPGTAQVPFVMRRFQGSRTKFALSKRLRGAIKNEACKTIFHLHGGFVPPFFSVSRALHAEGKKYIFTPHGCYNHQAMLRSQLRKRLYVSLFDKRVVENADFVHVVGQSEIDATNHFFNTTKRIELIPNGHLRRFKSVRREAKKEIVHFGYLGRLDMVTKGLDLLLQGFAIYRDSGKEGRLHIAGGGKDEARVRQLVKALGIDRHVTLHGPLFSEAKNRFFEVLDFFCLTSRNEGLPGVVMESLDRGIPCIVSKQTNTGRWIEKYGAGYVLRDNTATELSHCLTQADSIRSTLCYQEQSLRAQKLVMDECGWNPASEQLIAAVSSD